MSTHRHLACILPPQILERIILRGTPEQREAALRTLSLDHTFRSVRAQNTAARTRGLQAISAHPEPGGTPSRTIADCRHREDPTGAALLRSEGQGPCGDVAADEAYDGLGATYDLYWQEFQRDSIDGAGLPLKGYVHYGAGYDNAFWDGRQMIFGDGDGQVFARFTIAVDVIGHELTHGVTEVEAQLAYQGQSGALNESVSDVFGSLVKQRALGQGAQEADWLIGAGLLLDAPGQALRSLKAPGTAYDTPALGRDPQPATMAGYVRTTSDNGGVHTNSGIPNHAFYLAAAALGGNAWDLAGHVWYEALRDPGLPATATFRVFAAATLRAVLRLGYTATSSQYRAVAGAWTEVGVTPAGVRQVGVTQGA